MRTTTIHSATWVAPLAFDIANATQAINLSSFSVQPPRKPKKDAYGLLWEELVSAANRGLPVTIVMSAPSIAHPATLRNGYAAEWLALRGIDTLMIHPGTILHAKAALIDNRIAWVGSGNLTTAAAMHNREIWMRSTDHESANELRAWFRQLARAHWPEAMKEGA